MKYTEEDMLETFKGIHGAYELVKEEYLEDRKAMGGLLKHKGSGARIALISNDDDNKVFLAGFRTTPTDFTGVPHIMEHSVLCGSKNFPLKDPFVELVKGSLNTFLNAITYPDKTVYPVASCNDKDFRNLMHVYLDAVFNPNIYEHPEIFMQEGWHYEMEDKDSPLTINGVVYNEMKGAYSNPEDIMFQRIMENAFPDTTYGCDSGGDPDFIPELTYEAFLDFHRRYYHPSNSYIYVYGNADMADTLDFIDREYLSKYTDDPVDSAIKLQPPFDGMKDISFEYPVNAPEDEEDGGYLSFSVVTDESSDPEEYVARNVLQYVLMDSPGAPVKRALIDAGIGKDVHGEFTTEMRQPLLSIIAGNADVNDKDRFLGIIRETFEKLKKEGLNKKTIEGALNIQEFAYRESDHGGFPKGLMMGLRMFDSWLYNENEPFVFLNLGKVYDSLRKKAGEGYFEDLMERYFMTNPHAVALTMVPRAGLSGKKEAELKEKLAEIRASMTPEQIEETVNNTKALRAYQEEPDTEEAIAALPLLDIEDIKKKADPPVNEYTEADGVKQLFHDVETDGIVYQTLLFDISDASFEELPYISILASLMGKMDTQERSYSDLTDEMTLNVGGFSVIPKTFSRTDGTDIRVYLTVYIKCLKSKLEKTEELAEEVLVRTLFTDENRLKELVGTIRSRILPMITSSGSRLAALRAASYISEEACIGDLTAGLGFELFIKELDDSMEHKAGELRQRMEQMAAKYFTRGRLMLDITCSKELKEEAYPVIKGFADRLPAGEKAGARADAFVPELKNEAFIVPGNVQFNAVAGDFSKAGLEHSGALRIMEVVMRYDYLWMNLRVKGGAYGCSSSFRMDGNGIFSSFRDPNLKNTYDVFEGAGKYIRELELSDRDMHKYIIGAVSDMDLPLTPSGVGSYSLSCFMSGITEDILNEKRAQVLNADPESFRKLADHLDAVCACGARCTIGTESAIEKDRELFKNEIRI